MGKFNFGPFWFTLGRDSQYCDVCWVGEIVEYAPH